MCTENNQLINMLNSQCTILLKNSFIDAHLEGEDGQDSYFDLDNFIVPDEDE